jgi:hypothetical protein
MSHLKAIAIAMVLACGGEAYEPEPELGKLEQALVPGLPVGFGLKATSHYRCTYDANGNPNALCQIPEAKRMRLNSPPVSWEQYQREAYVEVGDETWYNWGDDSPAGATVHPWEFSRQWQGDPPFVVPGYFVAVRPSAGNFPHAQQVYVNAHVWDISGTGINNLQFFGGCDLEIDWNEIENTTDWPAWTTAQRKMFMKGVFRRGIWQCMGDGLHDLGWWGGYLGRTSPTFCETFITGLECSGGLDSTPTSTWRQEAGRSGLEHQQMDFGSRDIQSKYDD